MQNHTDLINFIAEKIGAKTYLEIGVFNPDHNFNKINIEHKVGVDPAVNHASIYQGTSDDYFIGYGQEGDKRMYDLIFIDGLHHADQVQKDVINSWACLNPGGVIVMHDCNPPTEATTCVPRGKQREWCGDVFLIACNILHDSKFTVDFDYGCTVLRKGGHLDIVSTDFDWDFFNENRVSLLNLVSVDNAIKRIEKFTKIL